jgi:serine/threonine protein kinase
MSPLLTASIGPGDLLDHYRIENLVATGGMASVFRATDTRSGRVVAVKIPRSDTAIDPRGGDQLRSENEISRKFDHPGLVKVLAGDGANAHYVVMEWIEGQSLRAIIDEQKIVSKRRAIRITIAICDALEYLHRRGVVHHDLKPDNVIVDSEDNVKLIDFGIAASTSLRLGERPRTNAPMGTPDYVSPEQIQGKRGDARSDVYSLGIMLYEMLTGEVPFSGVDPAMAMHLRSMVDAPCPGEINPTISARLREIIRRALARDPAGRFASARAFAWNLSAVLAEESVRPSESLAGF